MLTLGIVLTAGQARAQRYDPAYPVCLYIVSAGTSPYYRCSYTTMDQCRAVANGQMCSLNPYYAGAKPDYRQADQDSPRPLRPDRTCHPSRRSTTGPHRTIKPMNRIMGLPRVTRPAKKNSFSIV